MLLPEYIKKQPKFWKFLPWLSSYQGVTINKNIYLQDKIYNNLQSSKPSVVSKAVLAHEMTHHQRLNKMGVLKFGISYLLSGKFRFDEELLANKEAFKIQKKSKFYVDLDRKAKILSGWIYLWSVSYKYAKKKIEKAWKEV